MTNTEVYDVLKKEGIAYRESVFKALEKLKAAGLLKRTHEEKTGYKYSLNFSNLKVGARLSLIVS